MIAFQVNDMTCGHCAAVITQAVKGVDQHAKLSIDLARHRVGIESADAGVAEFAEALKAAGYTPVAVVGDAGA